MADGFGRGEARPEVLRSIHFSSVVVKYVCSPRHNPLERLKAILAIPPGHKDRPFAELDTLYTHIFSMCDDLDTILTVFRVQLSPLFGSALPYFPSSPKIFKSSKEEIELVFNDLVSVISLMETTIQFCMPHFQISWSTKVVQNIFLSIKIRSIFEFRCCGQWN